MTLKGERMSKSTGNMLTPDEVMAVTGPDAFRYYLLAENQFSQDGNFAGRICSCSSSTPISPTTSEISSIARSDDAQIFPGPRDSGPAAKATHSAEVHRVVRETSGRAGSRRANGRSLGVRRCDHRALARLNLYIDRTKPWALAKANTPASQRELEEVLYTLLEGVRWIGTALISVLPFGMPELFRQLAIEKPAEHGAIPRLKWGEKPHRPGEPKPLYPRLELPKA